MVTSFHFIFLTKRFSAPLLKMAAGSATAWAPVARSTASEGLMPATRFNSSLL
jgi:hypothetical protein